MSEKSEKWKGIKKFACKVKIQFPMCQIDERCAIWWSMYSIGDILKFREGFVVGGVLWRRGTHFNTVPLSVTAIALKIKTP